MTEVSVEPDGGLSLDPDFFLDFGERRPHQIRLQGGDARAGLVLQSWSGYLTAVLLHAGAMFSIAGSIALLVHFKLGLGLLRKAWFNLDVVWSLMLVGSGAAALLW